MLVPVAERPQPWLLAALRGLDALLRRVAVGVAAAATGVVDQHARVALGLGVLQGDERLLVAKVDEVAAAGAAGGVHQQAADVHALALRVPALVVIARDVVRRDALALRVELDHQVNLRLHAMGAVVELVLVEACLALNPVAAVVDCGHALASEPVVQAVEHVVAVVL